MLVQASFFLILFSVIITADCNNNANNKSIRRPRILGGDYVNIRQVPYLATIFKEGKLACGAAIISEYWLVTAAHCFSGINLLAVSTGATDLDKEGEIHDVESVHVHEKFTRSTKDNDIALIKLSDPITFSDVQKPISIANEPPEVGGKVTISGFGITGKEANYRFARSAVVTVTDLNICQQRHPKTRLTNSMFCAYERAADACVGDSGGPAVINNKLAGVISFGDSCYRPTNAPGGYTKVYNYRNWIANVTGLKL